MLLALFIVGLFLFLICEAHGDKRKKAQKKGNYRAREELRKIITKKKQK